MKMTLSSSNNRESTGNEKQQINIDNRSVSPCSSPKGSPRPSPRPQNKREHAKPELLLTVNHTKEQQLKHEGSPSSQEGSINGRQSAAYYVDLCTPQTEIRNDGKSESGGSSKDKRDSGNRIKKKSSWFNSLYPTYKSRSEDFKKLFKDVPDEERLVVDYSCALQKEILVQGRLYVTQNYLCFYANIFGWETNLTLKWKDVAAITKEKTALVIPNAVLICTKTEKWFFTSLVSRDKTYLMLFRVWQNALMDQPMSSQEMWSWVHQCYGDELGLTSDDEDYIAPGNLEEDKLSGRLSVESFQENEDRELIEFVMDERPEDETKLSVPSSGHRSGSPMPTDVTDNSESEGDRPIDMKIKPPLPQLPLQPFQNFLRQHSSPSTLKHLKTSENARPHVPGTPDSDDSVLDKFKDVGGEVRCTAKHEGRTLLDEIVPIHIDQLFTLLFTSSKFYLDFHASRKTTDLTQTPWTHNPLDNSKSRVVNLTLALSQAMGPKSVQVTETQIMAPCSKAGRLYAIDVDTINAGVPYADSFSVQVHYCLQKMTETQSSISVFGQIKYKKSVWGLVKAMIERNCWSGLDDFFTKLKDALHAEGEENIPELKRKSRRKRRLHSMPRSVLEETRLIAGVPRKKILPPGGLFSTDVCTLIVFAVLLLLLVLNVMLYYKLWSLEETPYYSLLDLHVLKNPPKSHEEWIALLQQQEALHTVEAHKWQRILKTSVQLLRQAEESLNELQRSVHPNYLNKIMTVLKDSPEEPSDVPRTEL